jgi:hypothetical protein
MIARVCVDPVEETGSLAIYPSAVLSIPGGHLTPWVGLLTLDGRR